MGGTSPQPAAGSARAGTPARALSFSRASALARGNVAVLPSCSPCSVTRPLRYAVGERCRVWVTLMVLGLGPTSPTRCPSPGNVCRCLAGCVQ